MATPNVREHDRFLKHVIRVREEIRGKFFRAYQVLGERETELLSQLDQLEKRYRGDGIAEQIEDLNKLKEVQLATSKVNKNKDLVIQHVSELDDRVKKIREDWEMERASMRRVGLEWDAELETRLSELGAIRVSSVSHYNEKENSLIVAGKHSYSFGKSKSAGVFRYPSSIAIHPETNNVYVCDKGNNRVQVFTKSLQFSFDFSEKMHSPSDLCISNNSVYVTQYSHCLNEYTTEGEFLKSVGKQGKKELQFVYPYGVAASNDKNRIYICDNFNNRIQCLNLNLTFNSIISDIPFPLDIKLTAEEILVLTRGEHCIRYYNYAHQLIREVIPLGEGGHVNSFHFCLDAEQNILMTETITHCVLIFTSKGKLIHKFGREGTGRGEFSKPRGIAVDSEDRIIVASHNPNFCLQIF